MECVTLYIDVHWYKYAEQSRLPGGRAIIVDVINMRAFSLKIFYHYLKDRFLSRVERQKKVFHPTGSLPKWPQYPELS